MEHARLSSLIEKLIAAVERRVPEYLADPVQQGISGGNIALCLIDDQGQVYGKMFGPDKNRRRHSFRVAWQKASQVWITGIKTGEYEKLVFTQQIDPGPFGIIHPDFIGWEGGQPLTLADGTSLAAAFSGLTGDKDLEIVSQAAAEVLGGQ